MFDGWNVLLFRTKQSELTSGKAEFAWKDKERKIWDSSKVKALNFFYNISFIFFFTRL